jgi:hypothetical protein
VDLGQHRRPDFAGMLREVNVRLTWLAQRACGGGFFCELIFEIAENRVDAIVIDLTDQALAEAVAADRVLLRERSVATSRAEALSGRADWLVTAQSRSGSEAKT